MGKGDVTVGLNVAEKGERRKQDRGLIVSMALFRH